MGFWVFSGKTRKFTDWILVFTQKKIQNDYYPIMKFSYADWSFPLQSVMSSSENGIAKLCCEFFYSFFRPALVARGSPHIGLKWLRCRIKCEKWTVKTMYLIKHFKFRIAQKKKKKQGKTRRNTEKHGQDFPFKIRKFGFLGAAIKKKKLRKRMSSQIIILKKFPNVILEKIIWLLAFIHSSALFIVPMMPIFFRCELTCAIFW